MKKNNYILKEAGIWLIAGILVLTAIVIVPTAMAQPLLHNVGIKSIDLPVSGFAGEHVPIQVTVENPGDYTEVTDVQVEIIKIQGGTPEYAELFEDLDVPQGQDVVVPFPDWMPSDWGDPAHECLDVDYRVTAYTLLDDDPYNDKKFKDITLRLDSIPPVINFFVNIPLGFDPFCLGILNIGHVTDACSGLDRVEWFINGAPWPPVTTTGFLLRMRWGPSCADIITIEVYDKAGNFI